MLLNCDLGESFGHWTMGRDAEIMPYLDLASIACGFHAGDPMTMRRTLALAARHGVAVGAHPAYPDLAGFGRRSMTLQPQEIIANLHYQLAAIEGMARCEGLALAYVKPHGALYHDMMAKPGVRAAILQGIANYHQPLPLVVQATAVADAHREEAAALGVRLLFEAFADRRYADDGALLSRQLAGSVLDRGQTLAQVAQLRREGTVTTVSGERLALRADTLCVHGDNPEGVDAIAAIRSLLAGG